MSALDDIWYIQGNTSTVHCKISPIIYSNWTLTIDRNTYTLRIRMGLTESRAPSIIFFWYPSFMDKPMYKLHQSCVSVKTLCNLSMVITPSWMDFLTMTIYYRQAMHWLPSPLWDNTHTTILYQNHQCRRNVLEGPFWWVIYHHLRIVLEGGYLEDHPTYIYSMDMYVQYIQCIYNYIYILFQYIHTPSGSSW